MPQRKTIKAESWRWFRSELERRLGTMEADALWNELARRRALERQEQQRRRAPTELERLQQRLAAAQMVGAPTRRLEEQIAQRRRLLRQTDTERS